jgi:hypothetical protein
MSTPPDPIRDRRAAMLCADAWHKVAGEPGKRARKKRYLLRRRAENLELQSLHAIERNAKPGLEYRKSSEPIDKKVCVSP